ncbi:MAG: sigma-54-dependent transcriptional regulator, partial [Gemmatimonadota bacterium]
RVLVVDDEPAMLENCRRLLSGEGYECTGLADPSRFRERLVELQPDVLLLDLRLPGVDGMTLLTVALAEDPGLAVVIMTAFGTVASAVRAIREGAFDYLEKPFRAEQLIVAVERAARHRQLTLENRALRDQVTGSEGFRPLIGSSRPMVTLMARARRVAPTDANVLIIGESGTGKELVARYLHAHSTRRGRPFLPVDCAAMPEGLMESELFGHERGAFTGAIARKKGLLEEARGGTVFLDEFPELAGGLQAKLLRALEERQVRRVGGSEFLDVDIRIVAATHVDLERAVAEGSFREDLYYRLNVVPLHVPPLRERGGDIPLLATSFLAQFSAAQKKEPPRVSPDVWDALESHEWPGNVRELKNLAERLVALDDDGRIGLADLPAPLRPELQLAATNDKTPPIEYAAARDAALRAFRSAYVRRLLELTQGNVSKAARTAGVSRRTFHRWLAELGEAAAGDAS